MVDENPDEFMGGVVFNDMDNLLTKRDLEDLLNEFEEEFNE